jgi:UDP-glucuronate decarboxylase
LEWQRVNVLITGGNGYIGSRLVDRFLRERHKPTVIDLDARSEADSRRIGIRFFQMAAEDIKCEKIFADTNYDVVIHLACLALPGQHDNTFNKILRANLAALGNILHLSLKFAVPKVVVLFDYRIYGQGKEKIKNENSDICPDNDIGLQEKIREEYCDMYRRQNLKVISLRTGIVYGSAQINESDSESLWQSYLHFSQLDDQQAGSAQFKSQLIDCLFINDLVEGIYRVCENQTSPILNISSGRGVTVAEFQETIRKAWAEFESDAGGLSPDFKATEPLPENAASQLLPESSGYSLDYSRIAFELDWTPKYSLTAGIQKTFQGFSRQVQQAGPLATEPVAKSVKNHSDKLKFLSNPDIENLLIFAAAVLASYWLNYRMGINLDLMLLYVVAINVIFGLRTGIMAMALAVVASLWFSFGVENIRLMDYIADVNKIIYLSFYVIIGGVIGIFMDSTRHRNEQLTESLADVLVTQKYASELYQSSLEVKNSLQSIIANTEYSFSKAIDASRQLDQAQPELLFDEAVALVKNDLNAQQVLIYHISPNGELMRLAAAAGPVNYPKTIEVDSSDFWLNIVQKQKVMINKEMLGDRPMVCAPISIGHQPVAALFLDGVDFLKLNQTFLNNLISITQLIGYHIERSRDIDREIAKEKYFAKTRVMKQDWFNRIIIAKQAIQNPDNLQTVLFEFANDVNYYQAFYQKIAKLVRSIDYIGELGKARIGILMSNVDPKDIPSVEERLSSHGFRVEWTDVKCLK